MKSVSGCAGRLSPLGAPAEWWPTVCLALRPSEIVAFAVRWCVELPLLLRACALVVKTFSRTLLAHHFHSAHYPAYSTTVTMSEDGSDEEYDDVRAILTSPLVQLRTANHTRRCHLHVQCVPALP